MAGRNQSEVMLVALLGGRNTVKYGNNNLLLGKDKPRSVPREVPGHSMSVANMLGQFKMTDTDMQNISVFLLAIKLPSASCFHCSDFTKQVEKAEDCMDHIQKLYGQTALQCTLILFLRGNNSITDFPDYPDVQKLLQKCSGSSTCNKRMNNPDEISELIERIKSISPNNRLCTLRTGIIPQSSVEMEQNIMEKDNKQVESVKFQEQLTKSQTLKFKGDIPCSTASSREDITDKQECHKEEQKSVEMQSEHKEAGHLHDKSSKNKLEGMCMRILNEEEIGGKNAEEIEIKQTCQQDGDTEEWTSEKQLYSFEEIQEQYKTISVKTRGDNTWDAASTGKQSKVSGSEENLSKRQTSNRNTEHFGNSQDSGDKPLSKNAKHLLLQLGLHSFFPNKQKTEDVLSIARSKDNIKTDNSVAFIYLKKLMMLNYRARFISPEEHDGKENTTNDSLFGEREDDAIHAMDVQMAVFHTADGFLKQNIVTKLSSCQYALPLLVPSLTSTDIEFPLWTFRQIKKASKSVDGLSKSLPVCLVRSPMVFFCRLGSVSTSSKSQLLNSLINPKHDTFFHRDSTGSSKSSLFKDGLVEIAWYCPAGNSDDLFSECIAFCNLHGDAANHRKQFDFMTERATVNIVLMQNLKLNDKVRELLQKLYNSSKPLICAVSELEKRPLTFGNGYNIKIGLKDRNRAELHKELITAVETGLKKCNSGLNFNLEESSELAKHCAFRVDEDNEVCQTGKVNAMEIMELLKEEDISQIKAKLFPCQGKLWHEWSTKNKQLHRLYGDTEQTKAKIQQEMQSIRDQQRECSLNNMISAVHKKFNSSNTPEKMYFVKWLGIYLDVFFSGKLSEVTQDYYKQLSDVNLLKQKRETSSTFKEKQEELERLSEKVDAMTVGLEHVVREMGQIYEAWSTVPEEMDANVSDFPAVAADLLISGHPLELMDGDAAHVPLAWIESVLDKVIEKLGDQRVFVLSVLGLQSSGKSTLLNTMFGLQFVVGPGRCTRGAFMQLLRVKEEAKDELKFDFLIVVDTEGLKGFELSGKSKQNHDNELSTFIIGLANTMLINVFGENPAEIQEVLQVAIQAIIRMSQIKLNTSCMFVHQNVTNITTAEKNLEENRRFLNKLDEVTMSVAQTEGCDLKYFNDVMKFNIQTDVHYIAQLWEGNPPMAPPNPQYSKHVEDLKQKILQAAAQQTSLKLSEFKVRIKDLWTAVLNEDFVFSFNNSLEILACKKLNVMYGNWTDALRKAMLAVENKIQNRIENDNLLLINEKVINQELKGTFNNIISEMEMFFNEDKNGKVLTHWRERTVKRIQELRNSLVEKTKIKLHQTVQQKEKKENAKGE